MVRAVDNADAIMLDAFQRCIISEAIYHFYHLDMHLKFSSAARKGALNS